MEAVRTVPEISLGGRAGACPLCGAPDPARRPVLVLQTDPLVQLVECRRCHAQSADRMPTDAFLRALYDPRSYRSSLVSETALARRCARSVVSGARFDRDRTLSILDYGGAQGALSSAVRDALIEGGHRGEIRCTIVDIYPANAAPHQRFVDPETFESSAELHDVILASAVLEHLVEPAATIRCLLARAADGALFYARTPWDSPLARVVPGYRVKWPRHLHDLGPDFWEGFMERHGSSGSVVFSRPSIVETSLRSSPMRTVVAHLAKIPARIEQRIRGIGPARTGRLWRFVGGWEVLIRVGRAGSAQPRSIR